MADIGRTVSGIAARLRSGRLDRALAEGADPAADRLLTARAAQLTSRQSRESLIAVLRADLDEASWFNSGQGIRPRRRQRELWTAKAELEQLIDRLRDEREVSAHGVARLRALVTDHQGPMYGYGAPGTLAQELRTAVRQLDDYEGRSYRRRPES